MIELRNISKIYRTGGTKTVKALDDVSLILPEKGMVFILGKSGCGKSTMLNILGGLDRPTSGEIVIRGRSGKNFKASDFDSYRNTFVGFIFQEYNVLPEFTVKQNVLLASELQNNRAGVSSLDEVMETVELKGLEARKPNTLSGGQKQRVAMRRPRQSTRKTTHNFAYFANLTVSKRIPLPYAALGNRIQSLSFFEKINFFTFPIDKRRRL